MLSDFLGGLADGEFDFDGMLEQGLGELLDLGGHGGREHDGLAGGGEVLGDGENVFGETHVEHAIGFVEDEERDATEVDVADVHVGDEAAGGGDDDVGSETKGFEFLVVSVAVVAAVDGQTADGAEVVAKALHGLIDLLGQLAGGRHDDGVDGVVGKTAVVEEGEDG